MKTWSGLGMGLYSTADTSVFDSYVDTLLANGFTNLRIDIPDYQNTTWLVQSKAAVIRAVAKGANVTWGVSSNGYNNVNYKITTENWPTFRLAILDAAQWAQDNGVFEFQLGNEEEQHRDRYPISMTRSGNVTTVTFTEDHGFTADNPIIIWGASPSSFNYFGTITITGAKTFTYANSGTNESATNTGNVSNLSEDTIQANIKALATDVQAIFTRGQISYTTAGTWYQDKWHTLGRGDIDILAFNPYQNQADWQDVITHGIAWWGADHFYLTEFSLDSLGINNYSTDEKVQAGGISTMLEYIKDAGITRAYFFTYLDWEDKFGAKKTNGTYRQLWHTLTASPFPVAFH